MYPTYANRFDLGKPCEITESGVKKAINIELFPISKALKKMDKKQLEIEKMIQDTRLQLSQEIAMSFQNVSKLHSNCAVQKAQLPENNPITRASCSSAPINQSISDSTQTTPSAAAATALPEISKFMYKCYTENKFCDITIRVPDGNEIRAHKNMLFSGSTVWRQILTKDDQLSIIPAADFERETIDTLVTFIYIDSVPKAPSKMDQLLIAAEAYGVDGLKTWCEQQLITTITIESAINLLVLAHRYNAQTLFDKVWTFVRKHTAELKQRDEWKSAFFSYPELTFELFNSLL